MFQKVVGLGKIISARSGVVALLTLTGIYAVHFVILTQLRASGAAKIIAHPFAYFPGYIWLGWDTAWYRRLFFEYDRFFWPPLYPFTLRLFSVLFGSAQNAFEKSALLLNFLSHAAIVYGLIVYIRLDQGRTRCAPWLVAVLILFFPGHNVFFAAYSESYYLALTIVAFILHRKGQILWSGIFAGVSALVRTMGVFLAGALFLEQIFYCIRDRTFYLRRLVYASAGVIIAASWHGFLAYHGTSVVRENAEWTQELLTVHVPPGANAKLWVLHHLAFGDGWEILAFWVPLGTIVYCAFKKRYLEALYLGLFYLSLAFYLYRPFPWSRFVSVLFPVQIMLAEFLHNRPKLIIIVLILTVSCSIFMQLGLFQGRFGEP